MCCRLGREEGRSATEAGNLNSADVVKEFSKARRNSGDPCGWQTETERASPWRLSPQDSLGAPRRD